MNSITFLRSGMTTVIGYINTNESIEGIFETIPLGDELFGKACILAKYYKNKQQKIVGSGELPDTIKCFPSTMTIICKEQRKFKIRIFFKKSLLKVHIASGLNQDDAYNYVNIFINFFKMRISLNEYQPIRRVLANGVAQISLGVNLLKLAQFLDDTEYVYLYTPDRHASLKIFTEEGTACVHSSGKVLYMGSKTNINLKNLHDLIDSMVVNWEGVPIFSG